MHSYKLRPATWGIMVMAVTALAGCRLTAQDGGASGVRMAQTPPLQDAGTPPVLPAQEYPEVLSRGPVHEAFAAPIDLQIQQGFMAPNRPPPNIEEVPPAERPQGGQFAWIPGYWSWDADSTGYIWVSACWRVAPPRMSWVPGYWYQVPGGWRWVAGFWAPGSVQEIEYLPEPPALAVEVPISSAPSPNMIWVPACMYWAHGRYLLRAGYWLAAQPDWVWVPSHYIWTPRGYIFAAGHWDYALERRGVVFAPVYFPPSYQGRSNYSYSPSIVIDVGMLRVSLFVYPLYHHYFFGDYYDDAYLKIGIYPRMTSQKHQTWYDPVYVHDRWQHQQSDPRWEQHERETYHQAYQNKAMRPPRTYHEQEARLASLPAPERQALQVTRSITVVAASRTSQVKFEPISTDTRQKISRQATAVRTFGEDRTRWESPAPKPATAQPANNRQPPKPQHLEPERRPSAPHELPEMAPVEPSSREPASTPPGDARMPNADRVKIPVSPIVGGSGAPGLFRKGPPARPKVEDEDEEGKDIRMQKEPGKKNR